MFKKLCFYSCNDHEGCGCDHSHSHSHDSCGCDDNSCGCGDDSGCGCGGGCHSEPQDAILIRFDDGTEYQCPVLSIFDINEQEYIALYHPEKQKALLYRFKENTEGIFMETIDDEEEFELVANAFRNL